MKAYRIVLTTALSDRVGPHARAARWLAWHLKQPGKVRVVVSGGDKASVVEVTKAAVAAKPAEGDKPETPAQPEETKERPDLLQALVAWLDATEATGRASREAQAQREAAAERHRLDQLAAEEDAARLAAPEPAGARFEGPLPPAPPTDEQFARMVQEVRERLPVAGDWAFFLLCVRRGLLSRDQFRTLAEAVPLTPGEIAQKLAELDAPEVPAEGG